jgi:acetyl-CoA carboxylase / biotin carboxylase 1
MEAKGCAKPVVWRDARRLFYWSFRARLAKSSALAALAAADPGSSLEARLDLVKSLASLEPGDDDRQMATKLEALDITQTVRQLKADNVVRQLVQLTHDDKNATMGALMRLVDTLSEEERLTLVNGLQRA